MDNCGWRLADFCGVPRFLAVTVPVALQMTNAGQKSRAVGAEQMWGTSRGRRADDCVQRVITGPDRMWRCIAVLVLAHAQGSCSMLHHTPLRALRRSPSLQQPEAAPCAPRTALSVVDEIAHDHPFAFNIFVSSIKGIAADLLAQGKRKLPQLLETSCLERS